MSNLYWPVYKNLEKEVLHLAEQVHFDDAQLSVYSIKIADLIIRCAVEIESLSKDLYIHDGCQEHVKDENGKDRYLYYDTDCLKRLDQNWNIGDRQIIVVAPIFYFTNENIKYLRPLKNAHKHSEPKWKEAYNAVKHDRSNSLQKGNIKYLLSILAALYILNIYYNKIECITINGKNLTDPGFGSDIFNVKTVIKIAEPTTEQIIQNDDDKKAIYIIRANIEKYFEYQQEIYQSFEKQRELMAKTTEKRGYRNRGFRTDFFALAKEDIIDQQKFSEIIRQLSDIMAKSNTLRSQLPYEAILNKNQPIYPSRNEASK
jgi:hypothetical protein